MFLLPTKENYIQSTHTHPPQTPVTSNIQVLSIRRVICILGGCNNKIRDLKLMKLHTLSFPTIEKLIYTETREEFTLFVVAMHQRLSMAQIISVSIHFDPLMSIHKECLYRKLEVIHLLLDLN